MLVHTGKIAQDDVDEIMQLFNEYDHDSNDTIDIKDIAESISTSTVITETPHLFKWCGARRKLTDAEVIEARAHQTIARQSGAP